MNILEIKNVNIYYGGKEVLREINIDVKKNEILCIMGPSGCGKSTLLSLINGFLTEWKKYKVHETSSAEKKYFYIISGFKTFSVVH